MELRPALTLDDKRESDEATKIASFKKTIILGFRDSVPKQVGFGSNNHNTSLLLRQ
jgi:hypothetical protein